MIMIRREKGGGGRCVCLLTHLVHDEDLDGVVHAVGPEATHHAQPLPHTNRPRPHAVPSTQPHQLYSQVQGGACRSSQISDRPCTAVVTVTTTVAAWCCTGWLVCIRTSRELSFSWWPRGMSVVSGISRSYLSRTHDTMTCSTHRQTDVRQSDTDPGPHYIQMHQQQQLCFPTYTTPVCVSLRPHTTSVRRTLWSFLPTTPIPTATHSTAPITGTTLPTTP